MTGTKSYAVPRRFVLDRHKDDSGVSGTGVVATGVEFPDGRVVTRWCSSRTNVHQFGVWDSIDEVEQVHGHGGHTKIRWIDDAKSLSGPSRRRNHDYGWCQRCEHPREAHYSRNPKVGACSRCRDCDDYEPLRAEVAVVTGGAEVRPNLAVWIGSHHILIHATGQSYCATHSSFTCIYKAVQMVLTEADR